MKNRYYAIGAALGAVALIALAVFLITAPTAKKAETQNPTTPPPAATQPSTAPSSEFEDNDVALANLFPAKVTKVVLSDRNEMTGYTDFDTPPGKGLTYAYVTTSVRNNWDRPIHTQYAYAYDQAGNKYDVAYGGDYSSGNMANPGGVFANPTAFIVPEGTQLASVDVEVMPQGIDPVAVINLKVS